MSPRRRLDAELVRRGLASSRAHACDLIESHRVLVGGVSADKPSRLVSAAESVVIQGPPRRYVSRGGDKLASALDHFNIDVAGKRCLDIGASTGGFTDCLLQRGALSVVALDVGHGQLDASLRNDPRVKVLERCNVRNADLALVGHRVDIVVCDVSFISLRLVIPVAVALCAPGAMMVLLVKPQFEAGRREVSKGSGVIRDPEIWERVRAEVEAELVAHGSDVLGWVDSPILGAKGNREFLVAATVADPTLDPKETDR